MKTWKTINLFLTKREFKEWNGWINSYVKLSDSPPLKQLPLNIRSSNPLKCGETQKAEASPPQVLRLSPEDLRLDNKVSVTAPGDVQVLISEHFQWKFITYPSYCTFHTFFFTESEKSKWLRSKKKQLSEVGDLALYHLMSVCTVPTLWETRGQLIMLPVVLWSPGQREGSGDWIMYNEGGVYSERLNTGPQHCLLQTL